MARNGLPPQLTKYTPPTSPPPPRPKYRYETSIKEVKKEEKEETLFGWLICLSIFKE